MGHLDFYPNAGRIQPGCAQLDGVTFIECNHKFSKFLLADSLLENDCQPVAYECDSFGDFKHVRHRNLISVTPSKIQFEDIKKANHSQEWWRTRQHPLKSDKS